MLKDDKTDIQYDNSLFFLFMHIRAIQVISLWSYFSVKVGKENLSSI